MQTLIDLDSNLFLYLNGMHTPFWDNFMMLFSGKFIWVPMYAAFLWLVWRCFSWKTAMVVTVMGVVLIALADQTCATLIRPYVERVRPSRPENPLWEYVHVVNGYRGGMYSFPSCHAANSFAFAVFSALIVRRRLWCVFILCWAIVNSYSRIYLGVHYPGDLLVGAFVGGVVAVVIYAMALFVARRWSGEQAPFATAGAALLSIAGKRVDAAAVPVAVGAVVICCMAVVSAMV